MSLDIFDINAFYYICFGITFYDLSALVDCWSSFSIRRIIYNFFNVCPFDNMAVVLVSKRLVGRLGSRKPV